MRYLRPSEEFRGSWQYDNFGYVTLSTLPYVLAGIPFTKYVQKYVLDPLGMKSATYSYSDAFTTGKLALGFSRANLSQDTLFSADHNMPQDLSFLRGVRSDGETSGPGGLIMSTDDAATWMQTLLLTGVNPTNNVSVIPRHVLEDATTGSSIMFPTALYPEQSARLYGNAQYMYSYRGVEIIEHGGDVAGFCTLHTRVPSLGLGMSFSTNMELFGDSINEIIKYRIIDNALGLAPIDWDSRSKFSLVESLTSGPPSLPRRVNATTRVPFNTLAKSYHNTAYGCIELCLIPPINQSQSVACKALERSLPAVLPGVLDSRVPTFVGAVDKIWSHLVLTHYDGALYNASIIASNPPVGSSGPNTVQVMATATAEFSLAVFGNRVEGFGLYGGFRGSNSTAEPAGTTVLERSEVFFGRAQ